MRKKVNGSRLGDGDGRIVGEVKSGETKSWGGGG